MNLKYIQFKQQKSQKQSNWSLVYLIHIDHKSNIISADKQAWHLGSIRFVPHSQPLPYPPS